MTWLKAFAIVLVFAIFCIPTASIILIKFPADAQYNRKFASRVTMAYDQATFEGMKEQVLILWAEMNSTFEGCDYAYTYSSPWYWEQTYDNSLAAQQDYFKQLTRRLDSYSKLYQNMLLNQTNPIYLEDWYYKSIQNFRDEMRREGGLDWAINRAWYLKFAPAAYWLLWWLIPLEIALILITLYVSSIAWEWNWEW